MISARYSEEAAQRFYSYYPLSQSKPRPRLNAFINIPQFKPKTISSFRKQNPLRLSGSNIQYIAEEPDFPGIRFRVQCILPEVSVVRNRPLILMDVDSPDVVFLTVYCLGRIGGRALILAVPYARDSTIPRFDDLAWPTIILDGPEDCTSMVTSPIRCSVASSCRSTLNYLPTESQPSTGYTPASDQGSPYATAAFSIVLPDRQYCVGRL